MTKKYLVFPLALLLMLGTLHSQTRMAVPHGSFEQWTSHPGYNLSVLIFNLPIYDSYSTPTGWDYLSYPVNYTLSVYGSNVNINTSLPLVMVSQETGSVPDSNTAVKLQTFMLSDLIGSVVYTLLESELDSMLTQMVFPSILSSGVVNLDSLLPIVTTLFSNADSANQILMSLASTDVNHLISGGIALGGFEPTRLTGSYKYHSADSGDNGGVIMLGTHYNTTTQQREVVGGGANINLTDITNYTPFSLDYYSLHELEPTFAEQSPDSLILLFISSASENRQQGSYLCLDNLQLWHDTVEVVMPDTCADIVGMDAIADIHEVVLNWSASAIVDGFEVEYGIAGFAPGSGTALALNNNTCTLTALAPNTTYDAYLRTVCNDSIYGSWAYLQFTTLPDTCAQVRNLSLLNIVYDSFPSYILQWEGTSQPRYWEVEYGLQGFDPGTGVVITTDVAYLDIDSLERTALQPNTWYDFYVRSVCENDVYGEWDSVHYRTFCSKVFDLTIIDDSLSFTPDSLVAGYKVVWSDTTDAEAWTLSCTASGYDFPGAAVFVSVPEYALRPLRPDEEYVVSVSSSCGEGNYGEEVTVYFTTIGLPIGIAEADAPLISVTPNPANGRCLVGFPTVTAAEIGVYSIDGRLLQTVSYKGAPVELLLPGPGVYILQATTPRGTITRRIVNK